jgi:hypothetical protein
VVIQKTGPMIAGVRPGEVLNFPNESPVSYSFFENKDSNNLSNLLNFN